MLAIRSPDKLTRVFVALDELPRWAYPISICVPIHHPSFPHTASSTIQNHFVSSLHCSWSTSSTIPLTLPLPPPHQPHDCSFSPVCHLHTLLRLHSSGMVWRGRRGKTPQQALPPCPTPSPTAPERDPSALLLFFFSNCVGAPHPRRGNKSPPSWKEEDQRSSEP